LKVFNEQQAGILTSDYEYTYQVAPKRGIRAGKLKVARLQRTLDYLDNLPQLETMKSPHRFRRSEKEMAKHLAEERVSCKEKEVEIGCLCVGMKDCTTKPPTPNKTKCTCFADNQEFEVALQRKMDLRYQRKFKVGDAVLAKQSELKHHELVRCAFFDRNPRSRVPLVPTPARLKRCHACDQCHSSRASTFLAGSHCKLRANTEGICNGLLTMNSVTHC
jgi:hypothetical protein